MPRLFTGLELPQSVWSARSSSRAAAWSARAGSSREDYHVTLRFVGDIDARTAHEIAEALGQIRRAAAPVRFDGLGWFGGDKPRQLVARIEAEPGLMELQAEQERRLRRMAFRPRRASSCRT